MQKRLRRFRADETIANMIDVGVAHITCGIVREKCRSPSTHNVTRLPLWVDNCRKIAIALKMPKWGEQTVQACDTAWFSPVINSRIMHR
jgi:hypothetical protein